MSAGTRRRRLSLRWFGRRGDDAANAVDADAARAEERAKARRQRERRRRERAAAAALRGTEESPSAPRRRSTGSAKRATRTRPGSTDKTRPTPARAPRTTAREAREASERLEELRMWPPPGLEPRERRRRQNDTGAPARRAASRARAASARQLRAQARRTRRLRRQLRTVALAGSVVVLLLAWHHVPRMDVFTVRHVAVVGASAVPDLLVRSRIDQHLKGHTIYTVDQDAVADEVRKLPFIHTVKVERHFPNGISVEVTEYSPLAFGIAGRTGWLVARDGRVLTKAHIADWRDRVPVVLLSRTKLSEGDLVGDEPALRILRSTPHAFPGSFRSIERRQKIGYVGTLHEGPEIRFGRDAELQQKLMVAQRLLTMFGPARRQEIAYIDVTVPARPAVMMH